jgi:RimJ/RimL family protein N-acetyltransferase
MMAQVTARLADVDWPVRTDRLLLRPAMASDEDAIWAYRAEIGWVLHPDHTGQGYATEPVEAVLHLCFHELGVRRVTAGCFAANTASWRLMERVGMRREVDAVRDALHRSGEWMDSVGDALLVDEWRARPRA